MSCPNSCRRMGGNSLHSWNHSKLPARQSIKHPTHNTPYNPKPTRKNCNVNHLFTFLVHLFKAKSIKPPSMNHLQCVLHEVVRPSLSLLRCWVPQAISLSAQAASKANSGLCFEMSAWTPKIAEAGPGVGGLLCTLLAVVGLVPKREDRCCGRLADAVVRKHRIHSDFVPGAVLCEKVVSGMGRMKECFNYGLRVLSGNPIMIFF